MAPPTDVPNVTIHETAAEEGCAILARAARRYLDMSAEEFIEAWITGQFDDNPDRREVMRVAMLLPFAQ
jgi:hypothetical protein